MTRALFAVAVLLAAAFALLGLVVFLSRDEDTIAADSLLAEDLARAIQLAELEGDGTVDVAAVADFPWERVLIVAPGTPRAEVGAALGSDFRGELPFASRGPMFVFASGDRVARLTDYRGRARFTGFEQPVAVLPRDGAVLRVRDLVVSPG